MSGVAKERLIQMYKPSVIVNPEGQEKSLQVNLFELPALNRELRARFKADYQGKDWYWHRFFWSLPDPIFHSIEFLAVACIAFFNSPVKAYHIVKNKIQSYFAQKNNDIDATHRIGACFSPQEVKDLATSMRRHYSSCLWQKGDVLLIDNRQVMHAGMPGKGDRVIRALIANPLAMDYRLQAKGLSATDERTEGSLGEFLRNRAELDKSEPRP